MSGSREWRDEALVRQAFSMVHGSGHTLVHGDDGDEAGTLGLDRMAGRVAADMGWEVEPVPADWDRFGKAAGPKRNQAMVDRGADVLLAFPLPGSVGTWDCIRRADESQIPVVIVGMANWALEMKKVMVALV